MVPYNGPSKEDPLFFLECRGIVTPYIPGIYHEIHLR